MTSSPPGPDGPAGHSQLIGERLARQGLTGGGFADPVEAVSALGAVQSQLFAGGAWAIAQRCSAVSETDFKALFDAGRILRTHVLRPTWHFVAPQDLRWMLALTAPSVHATSAFYYRKGGLDDEVFRQCADVIAEALQDEEYLTRIELAEALARRGITAEGNRLAYIVMWCELEAVICSGPMRGRQHTYALVEERVPASPIHSRDWSLGELARRYFTSHGPAQIRDFAWWAGLRITVAKKGVKLAGDTLRSQTFGGAAYYSAVDQPETAAPAPGDGLVHLLPNYDEFVVAYQDRSALFGPPGSPADAPDGYSGMDALTSNLILSGGTVVGTWKPSVQGGRVAITVTLSTGLRSQDLAALNAAAQRYGDFLGLPADLDLLNNSAG